MSVTDPTETLIPPRLAEVLQQLTAEGPTGSRVDRAVRLAEFLQQRATELQTPQERKQQMELDRMIQRPEDKVTLTQMTDQAFRSSLSARAADQLIHILDVQGIPRFFSSVDRTLLRGFQSFGDYLPGVAIPMVKEKMRRETANVILPAEQEILTQHLKQRRDEGVRMNVNFLGEAILGEQEAHRRLEQYLAALQLPEIEVVSVKISTICSQIHPISREATIRTLCDRMELLYRAALKATFERADGTVVPKFVYMDMEEYRDLSLTAEVFMKTLSRPGLQQAAAGIVLQAYVPDSWPWQQRITEWARERVNNGGFPITVRIVKGANMEMERVEASVRGWPQAPYQTKVETDANYKRMLHYALMPDNRRAVRVGIASHNLFEVAYALVLAADQAAFAEIQFEMLEGMANHQRRALHELTRALLLYAPACRRQDFIHAIGYLIRRLDENTGPENFLRYAFRIQPGTETWKRLEGGFRESAACMDEVSGEARRIQNRLTEQFPDAESGRISMVDFCNEPDTDFGLQANAEWAAAVIDNSPWKADGEPPALPLWIAGKEVNEPSSFGECADPSRPGTVVARYGQANGEQLQHAVRCAADDQHGWRSLAHEERFRILRQVAVELRRSRGPLMAAALAEAGKTFPESDPEVSEAVDFVEFYTATVADLHSLPDLDAESRGVIVVVSPWNFPIAIPCGGIAAALAAGNNVLLKPASDTVLTATELCECFYRAGVPREALQLVPCPGRVAGEHLIGNPMVDTVILTGGTDTALRMLDGKADLRLLAETGGKNATIVTSLADRDQAVKHILHSAFSHCGQKCSATSLLLLQDEVYEDEEFRQALVDAARSMKAGSAWKTVNKLGPLIRPPSGDLERSLKELEPGETWALMPEVSEENDSVWTPGIKWGVQPGSYTHMTEFFGPLLGVMRFRTLEEAIDLVNATGFGLTSGLESLDDREQAVWKAGIRAGNLYINRPTTGAIVLRQPFGGMGKSAFGPGIKAGGPNYTAQLMRFESRLTGAMNDLSPTEEIRNPQLRGMDQKLAACCIDADSEGRLNIGSLQIPSSRVAALRKAIRSYDYWADSEFLKEHDHFKLVGQDNIRRYLPMEWMCIRVEDGDEFVDTACRILAARAVQSRIVVSAGRLTKELNLLHDWTEAWAADIEFLEQSDEELSDLIRNGHIRRLRYADPARVPDTVRTAAIGQDLFIADEPVLLHGRIELLWYVREQSLSIDYHRYGNLGNRTNETRSPVL